MSWSSGFDTSARGTKKVSERILQDGRAFVYNEETADKILWTDIPIGSIMINTKTGVLSGKLAPTNVVVMKDGSILSPAMVNNFDNMVYYIKDNLLAASSDPTTRLTGLKKAMHTVTVNGTKSSVQYKKSDVNDEIDPQYNWVPLGVKDDGTICISKDTIVKKEVYTIKNPNYAPNEFTYENDAGQLRYGEIDEFGGFVFTLEKGHYAPARNTLMVVIDGCISLHALNGGIREISEIRFAINQPLVKDMYIYVYYAMVFRIGNPYPRIFLGKNEPEDAEIGDFWLDYDASLEEDDYLGENIEANTTISWSRITGKPTTIMGYGIVDPISYVGHSHRAKHILDLASYTKNIIANENINWTKIIGHPFA